MLERNATNFITLVHISRGLWCIVDSFNYEVESRGSCSLMIAPNSIGQKYAIFHFHVAPSSH